MGWQVLNTTRQTLVAVEVSVADNFATRFVGLMGRSGLSPGHGLLLVPCFEIHSFFMRFEFDALYLNRDGQVVDRIERMKPWRIGKIVRGSRGVLELPGGAIAESGTQIGDQLEFTETTPGRGRKKPLL